MSGVLPEGTNVGYYVGGKVIFFFLLSTYCFQPVQKCYIVINMCSDNFLEVTRRIY
jgi:hypothetical protein